MGTGGEIYLAIILAAFLAYAATLFWAMVTSSGVAKATDESRRLRDH
jgi:hypothetical protein